MLGIDRETVLRISAKTGEGVPELLDAVVERIPPPKDTAGEPLRALIFDSYYDQYRGVVSADPCRRRGAPDSEKSSASCRPAGSMRSKRSACASPPRCRRRLGPGEVGYLIAGMKTSRRPASARRSPTPPARPRSHSTATWTRSRWFSAAFTRSTATSFPSPAGCVREIAAERCGVTVRPRDVGCARLRLPLRLPRPAPHGHRPRAPRTRVQPVAHRHGTVGRVRRPPHRRTTELRRQPV